MIINDQYLKEQIEDLRNQTDKLYSKIYTDNDGISKSLIQMQASLDALNGRSASVDKTISSHETRLEAIEDFVRDSNSKSAKSDNFKNIVVTATVSFLVPAVILTTVNFLPNIFASSESTQQKR